MLLVTPNRDVTGFVPFAATLMSYNLPIDVLLMILDHVDEADLVTVCQVNKVCCSCSQGILYRNICV